MPLKGTFTPPGDKSISHRMVMIAMVGEGRLELRGLSDCDDVRTTLKIYKQLGGTVTEQGSSIILEGLGGHLTSPSGVLDCGNSGTTIRLLSGLLAPVPGEYILDGDFQLRARPMERVAKPLRIMGAKIETVAGTPPLTIEGRKLRGVEFQAEVPSAQVKSAVLFAALGAEGPTTYIENTRTRDHTERLFRSCGVPLEIVGRKITMSPCKPKLSPMFYVPGDPSGSAFFLTAAAFIPGSDVTAARMSLSETRIGFLKVLGRMGAGVEITLDGEYPEPFGRVRVFYNGPLQATEILGEEIPSLVDEVPILALAAIMANGTTSFRNVDELRVKEIDRLTAVRHQLGELGALIKIEGNDLIVEGPTRWVKPQSLDSLHDHRMAMTLSLATKAVGLDIPIKGLESASISYPNFFEDFKRLWQD